MAKIEETELSVKNENGKINSCSLLLPYYTSDKWTNKLKRKVKALADAYNNFYERIENEDSTYYKTKFNKNRNYKILKNNKIYPNVNQKLFNKTSSGFMNSKPQTNYMNVNENNMYIQKKILNELLPPVTNYNPSYDNAFVDGEYYLSDTGEPIMSPKECNIFCISAQHKNQNANMNKFYNSKKSKDIFYYGNHKSSYSTKNLFSSKANNEDFNKFLNSCHSKDRINFFKKNDYNVQFKYVQPKDRRQISALKDIRKKQYLDYIKAKSEDNYMRFYYNQ